MCQQDFQSNVLIEYLQYSNFQGRFVCLCIYFEIWFQSCDVDGGSHSRENSGLD